MGYLPPRLCRILNLVLVLSGTKQRDIICDICARICARICGDIYRPTFVEPKFSAGFTIRPS